MEKTGNEKKEPTLGQKVINAILERENINTSKLAEEIGLKGSPTYVSRAFRPEPKNVECVIFKTPEELARQIKTCIGGEND